MAKPILKVTSCPDPAVAMLMARDGTYRSSLTKSSCKYNIFPNYVSNDAPVRDYPKCLRTTFLALFFFFFC